MDEEQRVLVVETLHTVSVADSDRGQNAPKVSLTVYLPRFPLWLNSAAPVHLSIVPVHIIILSITTTMGPEKVRVYCIQLVNSL